MAGKIYAVRKGRKTGIFYTWEECKEQVTGFKGAEYKSFASLDDAYEYLGLTPAAGADSAAETAEKTARAYVDGSYDVNTGRFSCGAVIICGDGITEISKAYDDPAGSELRNVAGEIMGAREAITFCIEHGIGEVEIYHDYAGIGKWGDDEWKANLEMTRDYKAFVRESRKRIGIRFIKVKAHSGNKYNEAADKLAKEALGI